MKRSAGLTASSIALAELGISTEKEKEDVRAIGIVMLGAESPYALDRVFPSLFRLYCSSLISRKCVLVGIGKDDNVDAFREKVKSRLGPGDKDTFLKHLFCVSDSQEPSEIKNKLQKLVRGMSRIAVYFADYQYLQKSKIEYVVECLTPETQVEGGWLRCVVEKLHCKNLEQVIEVDDILVNAFGGEKNVYHLDHFVGKEMVQNILTMRFANRFLEPTWDNSNIQSVTISCREIVTLNEKTASDFDESGIIRDIIVDHLLNMMALLAMETPTDLDDTDCIREECAKLLRSVQAANVKDLVLGQYDGYKDSPGVDSNTTTPTFAICVLYINNPRWHGVPFILKAGKGLAENRTDIRIQYKAPHNTLFPKSRGGGPQNELVIRVQPHADVYLKFLRKKPGMGLSIVETKLDLFSHSINMDVTNTRNLVFVNSYMPDSYESLLYDVFEGDKTKFARSDELRHQWKIFDNLLLAVDSDNAIKRIPYKVGTRGPAEQDRLAASVGFVLQGKLLSESLGIKKISEMQEMLTAFYISRYQMEEICLQFGREMKRGLEGAPSSIAMLPTYVTSIPTSDSKGVYYALDLGGTNFRVTRFVLDGHGGLTQTDERKYTIPDAAMTGTAEVLFDFIADCIASLHVPGDVVRNYGFTFSFPATQNALDTGRLNLWTKNFTTSGVVGEDVVELLRAALKRKNFNANIVALLNDTTGTLVSLAYHDPKTMIGIILGTGTNGAYREKTSNITKLPEEIRKQGGEMIINMEWGNFGSMEPVLPSTVIDRQLDQESRNKGKGLLEKMISGLYLGEICRQCCIKLHEANELFAECQVPEHLYTNHSFESWMLSTIEYDLSSDLSMVDQTLKNYGVVGSSLQDRLIMKEICGMIIQRAARLTACAIASTIYQIGKERGVGCTVGFDGSVYEHHPSFQQRLLEALGELNCDCNLAAAKDGSGKGAALIACGASQSRSS